MGDSMVTDEVEWDGGQPMPDLSHLQREYQMQQTQFGGEDVPRIAQQLKSTPIQYPRGVRGLEHDPWKAVASEHDMLDDEESPCVIYYSRNSHYM